jgi:hypothetical protein
MKTAAEVIQSYKDGEGHLSFSSIKAFMKSPRHFLAYKLREVEQTPTMAFGEAFHMAVLEPDKFENSYVVAPNVDRRTKAGKAEWNAFKEANEHKRLIKHDEMETIKKMQEQVFRNDSSSWVFDQIGRTEVGKQWEYRGFKWRGFLDGLGDNAIADLKVCVDAHPEKVYREMMYKQFYHIQGFLYTIPEPKDYYIIWVDRGANVTVSQIKETTLLAAQEKLDYYLTQFQKCLWLDQWDKSFDFYAPKEGSGIYSF